jgi:spore coat protein A
MTLQKFKDELPRLYIATPKASTPNEDRYEIRMSEIQHRFHSDMPTLPVWAYAGSYPGPIIDAKSGRTVEIKWINQLPLTGNFPFTIDVPPMPTADMGTGTMHTAKPGHAVVHLHGAHCPSESDGLPDMFTHPEGSGHSPTSATYLYPNRQPAATLWFHDHVMGMTRLNVYAGLAGVYLLRDKHEASLNLPKGAYEVPLIIQDRMFDSATNPQALLYQTSAAQPEFFGDHIVVNGKVWPKLSVEARRYRFRVCNGSNSRFYALALSPLSATQTCPSAFQIGSDGGFLPAPVPLCSNGLPELLLAPGERADMIIDFSGCTAGDEIVLANDAAAPHPDGDTPSADTGQVLKFVVVPKTGTDTSVVPAGLPCNLKTKIDEHYVPLRNVVAVAAILAAEGMPPINTRYMRLIETKDANGNPLEVLLNGKHYVDPVSEDPKLDSIEIWELDNLTGDTHPIHLHLVQFQVLDRKRKDNGSYTPVDPNELGWKDTVRCPPGEITRIIARFTGYTGRYVWHCHMLEHEDHDMMRPLVVRP